MPLSAVSGVAAAATRGAFLGLREDKRAREVRGQAICYEGEGDLVREHRKKQRKLHCPHDGEVLCAFRSFRSGKRSEE
jgi:hypothetical protein